MSVFHGQSWLYLRHPNGGIDGPRLRQMREAGYFGGLITMDAPITTSDGRAHSPWSLTPWLDIIAAAQRVGLRIAPWAFLRADSDCRKLRDVADEIARIQGIGRPAACWNAEKVLDTGEVTIEAIAAASLGADALVSTTAWAFPQVPYGKLNPGTVTDVQLFKANGATFRDPRACRARFFEFGAERVQFQHGITDQGNTALPSEFPAREAGLFSTYTADDADGNYTPWGPTSIPIVAATTFPYTGPFYPPGHPKFGMTVKHPSIVTIKRALHSAGYGNFPNPDAVFNRAVGRALYRMQVHYGIPKPSGAYGERSWMQLRRLPTAEQVGDRSANALIRALSN